MPKRQIRIIKLEYPENNSQTYDCRYITKISEKIKGLLN